MAHAFTKTLDLNNLNSELSYNTGTVYIDLFLKYRLSQFDFNGYQLLLDIIIPNCAKFSVLDISHLSFQNPV